MNDRCWFTAAEALTGHDELDPWCRGCSRRQIRHDNADFLYRGLCSPTARRAEESRMAEAETSQQRKDVVTRVNPTQPEVLS